MTHTHQITDIPTEEKADEMVTQFVELDGCSAEKLQQENGKWTVNAICPAPQN